MCNMEEPIEFFVKISLNDPEVEFIFQNGYGDSSLIFDKDEISQILLDGLMKKGLIYKSDNYNYRLTDVGLIIWNEMQINGS